MSAPADLPPNDDLRLLRGIVSLEDPERVVQRRPSLVSVLEREVAVAPVRRINATRKRHALTALLAAAAVAVGVVSWAAAWRSPEVSGQLAQRSSAPRALVREALDARQQDSGTSHPLTRGTVLGVGSELQTNAGGRSEIAFGERARIELGELTRLELRDLNPRRHRLALRLGVIDVQVEQIGGTPEHLVIETPDSEVEVRGTVFRVEVHANERGQLLTVVSVTRGLVVVRSRQRELLLRPGMTFRSEPDPAPSQALRKAPRAVADGNARGPTADQNAASRALSPTAALTSAPEATLERASTLGEQNRLFERALAARDQGDDRGASHLFAELCQKYPASPLWSAAETERRRAVERMAEKK